MPEPWGAGPGLLGRLERSNQRAYERKRTKAAQKKRQREARDAALTPQQRKVKQWSAIVGVVFVIVLIIVVMLTGGDRSPSMSSIESGLQKQANLTLKEDGYAATVRYVNCVQTRSHTAHCILLASNGRQTSATVYIPTDGKWYVASGGE